jgi:FkbM family methyltransferase
MALPSSDPPLMTRGERRAALLEHHDVTVVVDVGANTGQFARALREHGYRDRLVSLEPLAAPFAVLAQAAASDPQWECRNVAAGASNGFAYINVAEDSRSSSLLTWAERWTQTPPGRRCLHRERVQVVSLDAVWPELVGTGDRVYLKVDTEGFEPQVLAGAARALQDVVLLECEISLVPLWHGAPMLRGLLDVAARHGFVAISIEPLTDDRATGYMKQVDAIFLNTPGAAPRK